MWPDLQKGTFSRICELQRNVFPQNQIWVFYRGGIDAEIILISSLRTVPSGSYGVEFTAFAIVASTITKVHILVTERNSDFQCGMEGWYLYFTKNCFTVVNVCGNLKIFKFWKCRIRSLFTNLVTYVSGFEKRAHFMQNAKIWQFSTYHNLKTPRALGFRLGL